MCRSGRLRMRMEVTLGPSSLELDGASSQGTSEDEDRD